MYQVIIVVHVLLGLGVVGLVLLQQGKGADAGAAFGSASSGSVFGAQGASSFLSRTTAILAALFFSTSLGLAIIVSQQSDVVDLMDAPEVEEVQADVPFISGEADPVVADSIPVIGEELPAEVEQIQKEIATMADTVKVDVQEVIEDSQSVISDTLDSAVVETK